MEYFMKEYIYQILSLPFLIIVPLILFVSRIGNIGFYHLVYQVSASVWDMAPNSLAIVLKLSSLVLEAW